jgi:DNA-binding NarL/FixJ family response regulator
MPRNLSPSSESAESRITVAVLGYDPLRLVGLRAVLESEGEFSIHELEPDALALPVPGELVLVGSHGIGSVFDAIAAIRSLNPDVKIILTGTSTSDEAILRAISAGVRGYLDEAAPADAYIKALRIVNEGSIWAPRRVLAKFVERVIANPKKPTAHNLSERERQVLELLVAGYTNKEIGSELGIEERTVKLHVSRLMRKAGVDNRIALSVYAITKLHFSGG